MVFVNVNIILTTYHFLGFHKYTFSKTKCKQNKLRTTFYLFCRLAVKRLSDGD